jgi:hypothetical protein
MKLPSCVSCGRPVLQLSGQFANLDSYYLGEGGPPRETAGAWHASCLAASPAATAWYAVRLRNHCDVRDFRPVAELDHWTVVGHPRSGDVVAFGRAGELVSLALGRDRGRSVAGGAVYPTVVPLYNVELDDEPVIADIQRGLDADGSYPVMALIDKLGIADRVVSARPGAQGILESALGGGERRARRVRSIGAAAARRRRQALNSVTLRR